MSASIAMPMAGLRDHNFPESNMDAFTASEFTDHLNIDHSDDPDHLEDSAAPDDTIEVLRRSVSDNSKHEPTREETQTALGNLLGALAYRQGGVEAEFANFNDALEVEPITENNPVAHRLPITNNNDDPEYGSRLPSFDATAAMDLFNPENFPQLNHNIDAIQPAEQEDMYGPNVPQARKESLASQESRLQQPASPQKREFEAFARLQFEDGSYYLNTYACELGRDVLAYRAALQKEREDREARTNGNEMSRSSSGRISHPSGHIKRQMGSQVQGSVISEQGGFVGIDEAPLRPPPVPAKPATPSEESESSIVRPAEYLLNPRTMPSFDYHRSTELQAKLTAQEKNGVEIQDDEQPAAVTEAHLPNPHMCPLIPIHGKTKDGQTDAELHKKISRRHVKIWWNFERDCWELMVYGRNGAFCENKFVRYKGVVPLRDGSIIQIAHVVLTFHLPKTAQPHVDLPSTPQDVDMDADAEIDADEALPSVERRQSESIDDEARRGSITEPKAATKINLKFTPKVEPTSSEAPIGPDGQPIVKRRGPGRPPKDGIMSTRERKEREKAAKLAAMREANGGKTPPPAMRGKFPKVSPPVVEEATFEVKPEKRKYTKRKGMDDDGNPIPDSEQAIEGSPTSSDSNEPKQKKARVQREKSVSPNYPSRESLTAEQLARPPESYAVLLYKILLDLHPRALPLKEIYRELKKRYPWFVYETQTEGWQSSVRHNLNSEFMKLFEKGDKEGKGFAWRAIPDAQVPQTEKKRTTQAPIQRPRPLPPSSPRATFTPAPGQSVQWQNNGAFPANGIQQPFAGPGPWPQSGVPPGHAQSGVGSAAGATQPGQALPLPFPAPPPNSGPSTANNVAPMSNVRPPPGPVTSGFAASNMPCTLDGIEAIKRFENEMYRQLKIDEGPPDKIEFWHSVFASAKKRVLHGYPESIRPEGETKAETTIMSHMQSFVQKFTNLNFKGFSQRATTTPIPLPAAPPTAPSATALVAAPAALPPAPPAGPPAATSATPPATAPPAASPVAPVAAHPAASSAAPPTVSLEVPAEAPPAAATE